MNTGTRPAGRKPLEEWDGCGGALAEDGRRVGAEHATEQGGVDGPQVDRVLEVALVEVGEAGLVTVEAVLHVLADDQDRGGGAVVRAARRVGSHAAPELAVDGQDHLPHVGVSLRPRW